jgi:hypothetical protein
MQVSTVKTLRPVQISGARHYCRQNFGGRTRANVSCRLFLRTRQCLAPARAAYKSGRRALTMDTQKPTSRRRQTLPVVG